MALFAEGEKVVNHKKNKIHPHKFTMWIGIGSIVMMFAGLTSAYIVKRQQPGWLGFEIPSAFWYSTGMILGSSLTMQLALKAFRERNLRNYRNMLSVTVLLGIGFIIFQLFGFSTIWKTGVTFNGSGAGQFLYVIAGLHLLHVIGGIIALIAMNIRAFNRQVRNYNVTPVEVVATYWHFVDFLWIYLFIFFIIMR